MFIFGAPPMDSEEEIEVQNLAFKLHYFFRIIHVMFINVDYFFTHRFW